MILFKACPRCGGDVDATYRQDVYCIQCAHRPRLTYRQPRAVHAEGVPPELQPEIARLDASVGGRHEESRRGPVAHEGPPASSTCPRCDSDQSIGLDRLRAEDNYCYRCRACGHIFSPGNGGGEVGQRTNVS